MALDTKKTNWAPIKKIVAVFVGSGLSWLALRLGVDLGPDAVNEAAVALVGIGLGYIVPDSRVST